MRYLKLAALGVLAFGLASHAAITPFVQTGVSAQGSQLDNDSYRPGVGLNGFVEVERPMLGAAGLGGLGVRANYSHYQIEGDEFIGDDINEGGVALTGMIGPNMARFQPKVGGHVGYARFDKNNYVDYGADLMAAYRIAPQLNVHALVTPSWFANRDDTDFLGTKLGLGVTWNTPGG
jgi:hypothetical protein